LPRISGSRAAQPDLPSLGKDGDRARRTGDAPSAPGRYEHYRAPRYRPQRDEQPETNFRDDFTEPEPAPERRQIRRYRYKD
ncbi:hypothetical protein, partial [Tsukamurella sp. 1534]|uniref:hypothetical protein n=1 Tax=Tsukamurella sp. 1534 TaxID=1151061 RepID=UPI000594C420